MAHDFHHGGELAVTFGMQGIALPNWATRGGILPSLPIGVKLRREEGKLKADRKGSDKKSLV